MASPVRRTFKRLAKCSPRSMATTSLSRRPAAAEQLQSSMIRTRRFRTPRRQRRPVANSQPTVVLASAPRRPAAAWCRDADRRDRCRRTGHASADPGGDRSRQPHRLPALPLRRWATGPTRSRTVSCSSIPVTTARAPSASRCTAPTCSRAARLRRVRELRPGRCRQLVDALHERCLADGHCARLHRDCRSVVRHGQPKRGATATFAGPRFGPRRPRASSHVIPSGWVVLPEPAQG